MNLAISKTRSAIGIHARSVSVEVHLSNGLPSFTIVGLAETAVKESKDRVRSAIINSQFEFPCRRITVNLAPASLPKMGSGFDLPIALGILAASGQIAVEKLNQYEFIAELALSGELRGINGVVPVVLAARRENRCLIIAEANAQEAALAASNTVFIASNLRQVCSYLNNDTPLETLPARSVINASSSSLDWSDVKGQTHAKHALEVAACGGHSVLLCGPPGSGKTMLAKRFPSLLPQLTEENALECIAIQSIQGRTPQFDAWLTPPFRSPHHTASAIALVGGGNPPKPGEISLAHHGVLFLDELPEFNKQVLETLREPIESGTICISRAAMQIEFPAKFQLIAAMNPCPCGQWGNPQANCLCSPDKISRYLAKLSAPLLDRIDIHINIQALPQAELLKPNLTESNSKAIRQKVAETRQLQLQRQNCLNAELEAKECEALCGLEQETINFLGIAMQKLKLSARAYYRLLRVSRTLADMQKDEQVGLATLKQALSLKQTIQAPK